MNMVLNLVLDLEYKDRMLPSSNLDICKIIVTNVRLSTATKNAMNIIIIILSIVELSLQTYLSFNSTPDSAIDTCIPHPTHEGFPQFLQGVFEHIFCLL